MFTIQLGAFDSRFLGRLAAVTLLFLAAGGALATDFNIADGDVYGPQGLISAINTANSNNQNDTIILFVGGTYTLTTVDNTSAGDNGLPVIGSDNGNNLTIDGGSGATIQRASGSPKFRILEISNNTNVAIGGVTISGGDASTGYTGGGIRIFGGTLTVQECTISGNTATGLGGGAGTGFGGGIASIEGALTVRDCTLSGNSGEIGGGIANLFGTATVQNCTFSGNTANSGSSVYNSGTLDITGCTFSHATDGVVAANGGIRNVSVNGSAGSLTLSNTILNAANLANLVNESGTVTSLGYNLSSDNGGGFLTGPADQINTDPMLDSLGLRDHGGPTQTIALLNSSTAIDKGKSFGLANDQRGQTRQVDLPGFDSAPGGDASDIGAFETTDPVQAGSTYLVATSADHDDSSCGTSDCTLREAIQRANGLAGANVINLAFSGTITLDAVGPSGALGELNVSDSTTINGPGARLLTISGNQARRVFNFTAGTSTISGLTLRAGRSLAVTGGKGGGILNAATLTVTDCAFSGNQVTGRFADQPGQVGGPANGGAVCNEGTLILNRCSFSENTATGGQGANDSSQFGFGRTGGGGLGGAVFNDTDANLVANNCTFFNNTGTGGKGGNATGQGGRGGNGGRGLGGVFNQGTMTMTACTLSSNTGEGGAGGTPDGGLGPAGGGLNAGGGTSTVENTISAGNTGGSSPDVFGTFASGGYNLIGNNNGSTGFTEPGDQTGISAQLGSFQHNGGPTDTMALLAGSPAIDQGKSFGLTTDQRSTARPGDVAGVPPAAGGDSSDIGAFEIAGPLPPPTPTPSPTATATPTPTATPSSTLANISTRLRVETGDNALIGGFIITGTQAKKIIVRGIGTSLPFVDRLENPTLELRDGSGALLDSNDNWVDSPNKQAIIDSTIPPGNDLESAIVATVSADNSGYTAIVRGVEDGTGIGVVEAYDLDSSVDSKLANISTRGLVQTGDNVLIAGTIITGQSSQNVIVRAIGPSLPVPGKLEDPTLELRDGNGGLVAANDNWRSNQEAEIIATTIPPSNDFESAIVATLPANNASYTAIVRGAGDTTGIAVVEVYALN